MSVIGGYQSDVNLQDIGFVGDFPIENSLGGFGITTGNSDDFELALDPPLTEYRIGLELQIRFNHPNAGDARINVNQLGVIPLMKVVDGILEDLKPGDLDIVRLYTLKFDGACFQVDVPPEVPEINEASENEQGTIQIATQAEVDQGADDKKAVTSKTLLQFVSDKVTGLWEDKGLLDATAFPPFPPGERGDAYTILVDEEEESGFIGDSDGGPGVEVSNRDVLYCINDNPGGDAVSVAQDWNVIKSTVANQATEFLAGIARIATDEEVAIGGNDESIVTPLKLDNRLDSLQASEIVRGLARIATLNEVLAGADDSKFISALKLAQFLTARVATEAMNGLAEIATQLEVDAGLDNTRIVTPLRLKNRLTQFVNREEVLTIAPDQISPEIFHTPSRNRYVAINGNLIVTRDIRIKPNAAIPAQINGHMINFPKPLNASSFFSHNIVSPSGNVFFVSIDRDGRLLISGTFVTSNEELLLNINPYLAKFPIEYHDTPPGAQP